MSRVSLAAPVDVYNFQTGTGNYFADSILVHNCDLHARHLWLVGERESLTERLMGDHAFYDARAAGWWVWGVSCWIGSGWCSGSGPWVSLDGKIADTRQMPHLGNAGQGVNRKMPHLGNAGRGVNRKMPHLGDAGRGVNRKMPHLGDAGQRVASLLAPVAERMRHVRVVCGDWSRVMGDSVLFPLGRASGGGVSDSTSCGVFLDPPYRSDNSIAYAHGISVCHDEVEAWCRDNGGRKQLRIALCGYDGEYDLPGWDVVAWKAHGGFGSQGNGDGRANSARERVWFSPHCGRVAVAVQGALL